MNFRGFLQQVIFACALAVPWALCKDVVHVVFSNHLDIGFDGIPPQVGFDNVIINKYFDWYFPQAVRLGRWFDENGYAEGHIYTAHAYLVSLYLSCPAGMGLHCPNDSDREAFVDAAKKGWITWTMIPHNAQLEMMDEQSLISSAHVTFAIDDEIGVPHKTVISQRDVPGTSRAIIPVLVGEGVRAISVGVNSGSAPPAVPFNVPFVWRDESNASVIAFWHPFGYGGHLGTFPFAVQVTPGPDCVKTPRDADGRRDILCFSWRSDNAGPFPDPDMVLQRMQLFDTVRGQFPGAEVRASTFEAFLDRLEPFKDTLPVLTGEIGDTWIHGTASDPVKMQRFRAIQRMRSQCLYSESCTAQDPNFRNFSRLLMKIPEHTWGVDTKRAPASWDVWANKDFRAALSDKNELFTMAEYSWDRQLAYLNWAVEALVGGSAGSHGDLAARVRTSLSALEPPPRRDLDELLREGLIQPGERRPMRCAAGASAAGADAVEAVRTTPARKLAAGVAADAEHPLPHVLGPARGADELCSSPPVTLDTDMWHVAVDPDSGDITSIYRKWKDSDDGAEKAGTDWAQGGSFGRLLYSTYSEEYFINWDVRYNPAGKVWAGDFCKPGSGKYGAKDNQVQPDFVGVTQQQGPADGEQVLQLHYKFAGWTTAEAGAPANVSLVIRSWSGSVSLMMDVIYHDKQPTRLPEAMWMQFQPALMDATKLKMAKVNSFISPGEVIKNGSHSLHVTMDGGVVVPSKATPWEQLQVAAMDAGLLAVGAPQALPDFEGPAQPADGFSWCLFNNAWGTNYVMWTPYHSADGLIGASMKFRFVVTVRDSREAGPPRALLAQDPHFQREAHVHSMYA